MSQRVLNPDQFQNPMNGQAGREKPVGWMDTGKAWSHREYDSSTPGWRDKGGPGSYDALKADIQQHGIREPLTMQYDAGSHQAIVGEGNHRLEIARELGHKAVPVTVQRAYSFYQDRFNGMKGTPRVSSPPKLQGKVGDKTKPSDVFGDEYKGHDMRIGRELHYKV